MREPQSQKCHRLRFLLIEPLVIAAWVLLPASAGVAMQQGNTGASGRAHASDFDLYQRGLQEAQAGNWRQALNLWLEAKQALESEGLSDPRIGIAYIELATEKEATALYPMASELYFWGFSHYDMSRYRQVVGEEVDRISPLLTAEERREWQELLARGDPLLNQNIKQFWEERDPAPSTPTNERLLEHWQRIAYARRHFRRNRRTVYGTDDRGLIYVRFGKPDRSGRGRLGINRFAFRRWTNLLGQSSRLSRVEEQRVIQELDRYNNTPEYEIWVYTTFRPDNPLFYLFGNEGGKGKFRMVEGVEELIPDRAFRRTSTRYTAGLLPGAVLETVYYGELTHYHGYFIERLQELNTAWTGFERLGNFGLSISSFRNLRGQFQALDRQRAKETRSLEPNARSTFEKSLFPMDMTLQAVRILNASNAPTIAFVAITSLEGRRKSRNARAVLTPPPYELTHNLILRGKDGQPLRRLTNSLSLRDGSASVFLFPHRRTEESLVFIAEAFRSVRTGSGGGLAPRTYANLLGIGKALIQVDSVLSSEPDQLELSDLVIGVRAIDASLGESFPFPVVPTNTIYKPRTLKTYLEIYHLVTDPQGIAHFSLALRVARLRGRKKTRKERIALSFDLHSAGRTSKETFDVDISSLAAGEYELLVRVTDKISGQTRSRSATFQVLKMEQED